jgi:PKD repeat protein
MALTAAQTEQLARLGKFSDLRAAGAFANQANGAFVDPVLNQPMNALGTGRRYDCGPGKEFPTPASIPWATLGGGSDTNRDVVNIWPSADGTPWAIKFGLRGAGIIINGVTDAVGKRPVFTFVNSKTAPTCMPGAPNNLFTDTQYSLEPYGLVVITRGANDPYDGPKPRFISFRNLEFTGAQPGAAFTNWKGQSTSAISSPAGVWIQAAADIDFINCVSHDSAFNFFSMAKDGSVKFAIERITFAGCRSYNGGVENNYTCHGVYNQSAYPIDIGCYWGPNISTSQGSSYKDRSASLISFDSNFVTSKGRNLDMVHSEEQDGSDGIAHLPEYGTDYIFNATFDEQTVYTGIHYGGDNGGEQGGTDDTYVLPPGNIYRSHLYLWGSRLKYAANSGQYRTVVFDLSLDSTRVTEFGNTFDFATPATIYCWTESAGILDQCSDFSATHIQDLWTTDFPQHVHVTHGAIPPTIPTGDSMLDELLVFSGYASGEQPPANVAPVADFTFTTSGLTVLFTDASTDSDGTIVSRVWDFGDGITSTTTNPSHAYTAGGTYNVTLTVTDNDGGTSSKTKSATVTAVVDPPPPPNLTRAISLDRKNNTRWTVTGGGVHNEEKDAFEEATNMFLNMPVGSEVEIVPPTFVAKRIK